MTDKAKRREFRLEVEKWCTNAFSWDAENPNKIIFGETIHVVEFSALTEAQTEIENLKRGIELLKEDHG